MKTKPLRGKALLKAAWNHIAKHPEQWDQLGIYCCFGARAITLSGVARTNDVFGKFESLCQISYKDAGYLFRDSRTLGQLRARVVKICGSRGVLPVPKQTKPTKGK